jgi:hypothetical protein
MQYPYVRPFQSSLVLVMMLPVMAGEGIAPSLIAAVAAYITASCSSA